MSVISTAAVAVTAVNAVLVAGSGLGAVLKIEPILEPMAKVGVPESWLVFPIGTLKLAGALGLALGLLGLPVIGAAAAVGLILYWVCAMYTHIRSKDFSPQFYLGIVFCALAVATLSLQIRSVTLR
ncbi:DoxX family protein [Nocardia sp. ET3-3]|uniref:DoxX family protein n=1 Tax=Nocardia terrae TaxID=2675851 RepID=A0A7K1UU59_9NOCA|nr:DoxX family protein [Nocardia terrae]MVU77388.1 DoxX family protein [Nocardia terrae]